MGKLCTSVSTTFILGAICATVFGVFVGTSSSYRYGLTYYKHKDSWTTGYADGFAELTFKFKSSHFASDVETQLTAQNGTNVWDRLPIMNHFYSSDVSNVLPFMFITPRAGYDTTYPNYTLSSILAKEGDVRYEDFTINDKPVEFVSYSVVKNGECPFNDTVTSADQYLQCLHINSWTYTYFVFDNEGNYVKTLYKQDLQLPLSLDEAKMVEFSKTASFKGGVVSSADPAYFLIEKDIHEVPAKWKLIVVIIVTPILAVVFICLAVVIGFFKFIKRCCCCCCRNKKRSMT